MFWRDRPEISISYSLNLCFYCTILDSKHTHTHIVSFTRKDQLTCTSCIYWTQYTDWMTLPTPLCIAPTAEQNTDVPYHTHARNTKASGNGTSSHGRPIDYRLSEAVRCCLPTVLDTSFLWARTKPGFKAPRLSSLSCPILFLSLIVARRRRSNIFLYCIVLNWIVFVWICTCQHCWGIFFNFILCLSVHFWIVDVNIVCICIALYHLWCCWVTIAS